MLNEADLICLQSIKLFQVLLSNTNKAGQRFTWSKTWCNRQQLWKAVITEDYNTQHSYQRSRLITWRRTGVKFDRNIVKKKQHKNYQDEDKKSAINEKLILRLRNLISKWFQLKIITNSDPTMEDQIKGTNNWIYKTKKSNFYRP